VKVNRICPECGVTFECWGEKSPKRFCSVVCGHSTKRSHGHSQSPEHAAWRDMKSRCMNPKVKCYPRYGGRGIAVCERWMSFDNFLADMGFLPGPGYTIERNNSNGNYEPSNCRWATKLEQARNRAGVYTPDEDAIIRDLASRGHTFPQISEALGKPVGSVQARAYRLRIRSGKPCNNGRSKFLRDDQHHRGSENV
jgi:hypothetical protein